MMICFYILTFLLMTADLIANSLLFKNPGYYVANFGIKSDFPLQMLTLVQFIEIVIGILLIAINYQTLIVFQVLDHSNLDDLSNYKLKLRLTYIICILGSFGCFGFFLSYLFSESITSLSVIKFFVAAYSTLLLIYLLIFFFLTR